MLSNITYAPTTAPAAMHNVMVTNHPIRYHTTEARRLLEVTTEGLSSNGINIDQFGSQKDGKYILCGGLRLTAHAAEQLHPSMGGRGDAPTDHMDLRTVTFMHRQPGKPCWLQRSDTTSVCLTRAAWASASWLAFISICSHTGRGPCAATRGSASYSAVRAVRQHEICKSGGAESLSAS
jgi:hypothetical protein